MRKVLFKFVIFVIVVFLTIMSVELFVRNEIPNVYKVKNDWLNRNSSAIELLVLGNSHCYYGICPEHLSCKSYNAAIVSQTLHYDLFILKNYNFKSLKDVIINVDISNAFDPPLFEVEGYRCAYYTIYMNYPANLMDMDSHWEVMNPGALKRKISNYIEKSTGCVQCSTLGFGLDYVLKNRIDTALSEDNAKKRIDGLITNRWRENFDKNIVSLMQIASFCSKRNIRLTVISTPLHNKLRKEVPVFIDELLNQTLNGLSHKGHFRYVDFSNDSIFKDNAFFDLDHLSDVGAIQLTEKIIMVMDNKY